MKAKNTPAVISIRLKGVGQSRVVHPGDVISGTVEIQPDSPVECRGVDIKIGWHTEGKGDRDEGIGERIELPAQELRPEDPLVQPFEYTLPDSPWSYNGHHINIVWAIEVKVDVPWATDLNAEERFVLKPLD